MPTSWRLAAMKPYTNDDGLRDFMAASPAPALATSRRWLWLFWLILGFLLGLWCMPAWASDDVSLTVSPRFIVYYRDPTYLRADFRIARHEENRYWMLTWASAEGISGSTAGQLDVESPIRYQRFMAVSPGAYAIACCLYRVRGLTVCDVTSADVY